MTSKHALLLNLVVVAAVSLPAVYAQEAKQGDEPSSDPAPALIDKPEETKVDPLKPDVGAPIDKPVEKPADAEPLLTDPPAVIAPNVERLPWKNSAPRVPGRKVENAKEMLEVLGVDSSHWDKLFHEGPLNSSEEETVLRILLRMPKFGLDNIHRWRQAGWDPKVVRESPGELQGTFYRLMGRALEVKKVTLAPELAQRYEFDHYYRVTMNLPDEQGTVLVCCRDIPQAWTTKETIDERAACDGLFLKVAPEEGNPPRYIFSALRMEWLPDAVNSRAGINAGAVFLGSLGFDYGMFDQVRPLNKRMSFTEEDGEPFYQLLSAMRHADPASPQLQAAPMINIGLGLTKPESLHGELVRVEGTVRRIRSIEIEDPGLRERMGIDRYYELYVFVQLGKQKIQWGRDKSDKNPRIFENEFPVTLCVAKLDPQLRTGEIMHEHVLAQGAFYRLWNYKIEGPNRDLPQPSPLVIAPYAELVTANKSGNSPVGIVLGVLAVGMAGIAWLAVWRLSRGDERFRREVLQRGEAKEAVSLENFNPEIKSGPDFRNLPK